MNSHLTISESELEAFQKRFSALHGYRPFPWQTRLFQEFCAHRFPSALDLPTGLGKTSVMAVWYLARAAGAPVPNRLVYVVDRRAVVDQATEIATRMKQHDSTLRVSTLRGRYADNREWLEDPLAPTIIVGTVDMIGSRLLFSGYGVSPKMRPYHAGLLGMDALVVLDEAHLVPSFEALLSTIETGARVFGPRDEADGKILPRFRLLSLSATGRERDGHISRSERIFRLVPDDRSHPIIRERLEAEKRLTLHDVKDAKALTGELATRAWTLATQADPARVLVFCNSRDDALRVKEEIDRRATKEKRDIASELLVGERRVHERERLFHWLKRHGFINAENPASQPTFLIATSAGEVGVDLDADHMVCDLVEWERMVQRLGRVNRRGGNGRRATVEVVMAPPKTEKKDGEKWPERLKRLRVPLEALNGDASPAAIVALKDDQALKEALEAATTPPPLRPALSRALVDAWSMTALERHTGRPTVAPWLRGWIDDEGPQTTIVWRKYLPVRAGQGTDKEDKEVEKFFEAAPPHLTETLETENWRAAGWLMKIAQAASRKDSLREDHVAAFALAPDGALRRIFRLRDLLSKDDDKRQKDRLEAELADATLIVDGRLGGLKDGLLSDDAALEAARTADDGGGWSAETGFRIKESEQEDAPGDGAWRESYRFDLQRSADGESLRWLTIDGLNEERRAEARFAQQLDDHQMAAETKIRSLAKAAKLPDVYIEALALAARLHDEGKRAVRWQRAFHAPFGGVYAKTKGPVNFSVLDGYRHEFGSLFPIEKHPEFQALSEDLKDLVLHLVAAHHGGARPLISTRSCEEAPSSMLDVRAGEVALRFARLQKRWGPWGLAWWEALLRAADQQASRDNDKNDELQHDSVRETA